MSKNYKLQKFKDNQFMLSVPSAIVRAKGWDKGTELKWIINKKGDLELKNYELNG